MTKSNASIRNMNGEDNYANNTDEIDSKYTTEEKVEVAAALYPQPCQDKHKDRKGNVKMDCFEEYQHVFWSHSQNTCGILSICKSSNVALRRDSNRGFISFIESPPSFSMSASAKTNATIASKIGTARGTGQKSERS